MANPEETQPSDDDLERYWNTIHQAAIAAYERRRLVVGCAGATWIITSTIAGSFLKPTPGFGTIFGFAVGALGAMSTCIIAAFSSEKRVFSKILSLCPCHHEIYALHLFDYYGGMLDFTELVENVMSEEWAHHTAEIGLYRY